MDGAAERPVVGLFGAFDTGELGEVALRRVVELELGQRRPDIDLIALAPFGADRPIPGDEGRPALPLPPIGSGESLGLDALIISGNVLGDDQDWASRYSVAGSAMADRGVATLALDGTRGGREAAASIVWFAVGALRGDVDLTGLEARNVWARDPATQERLGGTAVQSGDPVLFARRVFSPETLRRRANLLRLCGALPSGRRLVVETAATDPAALRAEPLIEAMTAALRTDPKLSVVVVNLDPTREPSADRMVRVPGLIAERVHHLPPWVGLDDVAAAISGSLAVLAVSPAGAHLAASLGVAVSAIDTGVGRRFDPAIPTLAGEVAPAVQALLAGAHPTSVDAAIQTLDGAFAELAQRLPYSGAGHRKPEPDGVVSALAVLQQRLVDERTALQAELSRVQSELDHLRAAPEHRLARPIREGYQRWQRRRT